MSRTIKSRVRLHNLVMHFYVELLGIKTIFICTISECQLSKWFISSKQMFKLSFWLKCLWTIVVAWWAINSLTKPAFACSKALKISLFRTKSLWTLSLRLFQVQVRAHEIYKRGIFHRFSKIETFKNYSPTNFVFLSNNWYCIDKSWHYTRRFHKLI